VINELGLGNAVHVNAYRIAGLIPGSLSLILADRLPWNEVFWITGAFMLPGMAMAWLVSEPRVKGAPKTLRQAVTEPFHEFIGRQGWRGALMVLGFIFLYKLGDSLMHRTGHPFLSRYGLHQDRHRPDRQSMPACGRRYSAPCSAACGWSSWGSTEHFGSSASFSWSSIFGFAWLAGQGHYDSIGAGRTYLALACGDRRRSARRRPRHSGLCRVHRPLDPPRLYGYPDGAISPAWPRYRARLYQCFGRLAGRITGLASIFSGYVLGTGRTGHAPAA
jgi:PAT family beta-lactamase induction signal transducer AmpG